MKVHYTDKYLLNPQHKVTVNLIGVGGTGSQVLSRLTSLNEALIAFNHPGIHVYAYDGDIASSANIGRQLFVPADIGQNKASILITRINRSFGYEWESVNSNFNNGHTHANITISCVDSAAARLEINDTFEKNDTKEPFQQPKYWLDFGNGKKTGQVILGTVRAIEQPKKSAFKTTGHLQTVIKKFPELKTLKEIDQGPSCSLAEAINKQDLYINPSLAALGMNLLWNLFRDGMIKYHGLYLNLETYSSNPIKIQ